MCASKRGFARGLRAKLATLRTAFPAVPICLGVFLGQWAVWMAPTFLACALLCACGLLLLFNVRVFGGIDAGVLVGLMTGCVTGVSHPTVLQGADIELPLLIDERPTRSTPGEIVFVGREILGPERRRVRCRAIDLPWRNASTFDKGDVVWVRGVTTPIERPFNPFSWQGWLWRQGISGEMRVSYASSPVHQDPSPVLFIRDLIATTVVRLIGDGRGGALFLSMAFGSRDVLSRPVEDLFKRLGIVHLLVVSGYQVSLIFAFVFAATMRICGIISTSAGMRHFACFLALFLATAYVFVVGVEMSALRALVAAACMCTAFVLDRRHRFGQRLATALLALQVVSPWAAFDIGVLLTFAALGGIGIGSTLGGGRGLRSFLWVTVCVWMSTSLIVVAWSGSMSWFGIALNLLLAAPWSILNCTVGVVGLIFSFICGDLGGLVLQCVAAVNEGIVEVLFRMSGFAGHAHPLEGWSRVGVLVALIISLGTLALRGIRALPQEKMSRLAR